MVGRSYGDTEAPMNLRTLAPIVGLQRRVLRRPTCDRLKVAGQVARECL